MGDPETGKIFDGVFIGETSNGALVRIGGNEVELSPQDFDTGRDAVKAIEAQRKAAEDAAKAAAKAKPRPQLADDGELFTLTTPNTPAPAVGNIADRPELTREAANVRRAERPAQVSEPAADATTRATQLRDRLAYLASQGKANGWSAKLANERATVEAVPSWAGTSIWTRG